MIWLSFGRWGSMHGRWFSRERFYIGWRWTPFVRVTLRRANRPET